eukprot:1858560-Prymnesium_polylepis.1
MGLGGVRSGGGWGQETEGGAEGVARIGRVCHLVRAAVLGAGDLELHNSQLVLGVDRRRLERVEALRSPRGEELGHALHRVLRALTQDR